jgi:hypothetical protein
MSMEDIATCNRYAYEASFLPENEKKRIGDKWKHSPLSKTQYDENF